MSWSELERLVEGAEGDDALRRALSHCRSEQELVLAARRLGFRITGRDLLRARSSHQQEQQAELSGHPGPAQEHCGAASQHRG